MSVEMSVEMNQHQLVSNNSIECVMCDDKNLEYFIPGKCLQENGYRKAHRICEHCWWNNFAKEGTNHSCPGCNNNIALNNIITIHSNDIKIIELLDDDIVPIATTRKYRRGHYNDATCSHDDSHHHHHKSRW